VVTIVTRWLITQDTDFCQHGREKPVPRYDKRLKYEEGYVEIQWYSNTITYELFLSEKEISNSQYVHSACIVSFHCKLQQKCQYKTK